MKNKKLILSATIISLAITAVFAKQTFAYQGDPNKQGPNYSPERHEAMEKAFANNDYNAWKNLMQDKGRVTQVINEGNFPKFAQAHKLTEEGKTEEANKIRQELGLGLRNGSGKGQGMGLGRKK